MATVNGKTFAIQHSVLQSQWTMGAADVGTPDNLARYPYHSIQMTGTFGGATVIVQGSDDGITWFTMADRAGTLITRTSDGRFDSVDVPEFVRPSSSGGGITTSVKVIITSRSLGH